MTEKLICRICGTEHSDSSPECPGCRSRVPGVGRKIVIPQPMGPLNDYPGLLTDAQAHELTALLDDFFKSTGVPVVVTIVKSTEPLTPPEFAFLMYNDWGIGQRKINRGLLILLALDQKHLETEVGLGLEKILNENESDEIIRNKFISNFKSGDFYCGLKEGTLAIMDVLKARLIDKS